MLNICWQKQGSLISVATESGRYILHNADKETRADILALLNVLTDVGQGCGGGWPVAFTRGWV